jgi:hypothetical protein
MKSLLGLLTLALMFFCQDTFAQRGPDWRGPQWRRPRPPHRKPIRRPPPRFPRHRDNVAVVTCAPEVVASNLQKADQVLGSLAAGELKSNATFTTRVAEVAAMSSSQVKTENYLELAGVDANNADEVLNFLYAREVASRNVEAVQANLDLTADQATLVINKLTEALRPL